MHMSGHKGLNPSAYVYKHRVDRGISGLSYSTINTKYTFGNGDVRNKWMTQI